MPLYPIDLPWKAMRRRWRWHLASMVVAIVAPAQGVFAAEPTKEPEQPIVFEQAILPLLVQKCARCHGEDARKAELDVTTAARLLAGSESGAVVTPGEPDESLLFEKVSDGSMPPDDEGIEKLTPDEVELVRRWIAAGARHGGAHEPTEEGPSNVESSFHDVLPIFLRNCTICHGTYKSEADLDLRTYESFLRGGKSGPIVRPGDPDASLLIQRVAAHEMPPLDSLIKFTVKPIEEHELEAMRRWIAAGAPEGDASVDVATTEPDRLVTDEERAFWSFQPPQKVALPAVQGVDKLRNPVDAFVLSALESKGLTFAQAADRAALLRRVSFDLIGLPPSPEEVAAFVSDEQPLAYERLVDRLLASPRYGERWARMWLDLAGYADSDGKREQDLERQYAWRYRDYVIRAFNADKPYDRFLQEQIAGDELADYQTSSEYHEDVYDNLVATGFLRMAPDPTWASVTNFVPDRLDIIADELDVLGSAVMGLTLKCARCHSHKFDPIPQRDYYRMAAVFKGAFDEYDWLKSNWHASISKGPRIERVLPCRQVGERESWEERTAAWKVRLAEMEADFAEKTAEAAKPYVEARLAKFPAEQQEALRRMLATPAPERTPAQVELATQFEKQLTIGVQELQELDPKFQEYADRVENEIHDFRSRPPAEPGIHALWDRGAPSPTYVYRRGDYLSPGRVVGPGVPSVLTDGRTPFVVEPPWPGAKSTGRRLAFARWLTQADNPLTARVIVNRIWKHHFGAGLVRTLDNFGKTGTPPSHPELLDWLARDFVEHGWSVKRLHRLLVTSATYRQSSTASAKGLQEDAENIYLARMPMQRLSAEQLYDALLTVAGELDLRSGGPGDGAEVRRDGLTTPQRGPEGWRRSIYLKQQRKIVVTQLEAFDMPAMNPNCSERGSSTVAPQALFLWNNAHIEDLARRFAERAMQAAADSLEDQIDWAHRAALGRGVRPEELAASLTAIGELESAWKSETSGEGGVDEAAKPSATARAFVTWCHALMNSAEFLYVD